MTDTTNLTPTEILARCNLPYWEALSVAHRAALRTDAAAGLEALREAGWRIVRTEPICCEKCEMSNGVRIEEEWTGDD